MWQSINCLRFAKAQGRRWRAEAARPAESARLIRVARSARPTRAPAAALVCAVLCLFGQVGLGSQPQRTAADRLDEARQMVDQGRAQDALDLLGAASEHDDPHVHLVRGLAHYHLGDVTRAVAQLEQARTGLTSESDRQQATEVLGLALMLESRAVQALPHLEAAVKARQSHEVAHVLAQAAILAGQPDTARRALALALGLDVDRPEAYVAAGQLMARLDMHEMAEAALREAVSRNASVPQAHYLLGQEALFRGRLEEAVALTRKELALNPLDAMALVQLGDALSRMARWEDALPVLQRAIWINPYYSAPYILLGQGHLRARQLDLAEGLARRAIAFDPNNRAAHYLLGQVLQQLGQTEAAKAAFTRAEQLQQQGRR